MSIQLTEVEVALVAFDLINSSTVKQLEAVNGVFLHLAQTHPPPQPFRPRCGRLASSLVLSHGCGFSQPCWNFLNLWTWLNLRLIHVRAFYPEDSVPVAPEQQRTPFPLGRCTASDGQRWPPHPLCGKGGQWKQGEVGLSWVTGELRGLGI